VTIRSNLMSISRIARARFVRAGRQCYRCYVYRTPDNCMNHTHRPPAGRIVGYQRGFPRSH